MRWPIETCFAECKGELGMDHYELRFWRGWHHHMTLVILAHHFLVRWQQRLNQREGGPAPHDHASLGHACCSAQTGLAPLPPAQHRSGALALTGHLAPDGV